MQQHSQVQAKQAAHHLIDLSLCGIERPAGHTVQTSMFCAVLCCCVVMQGALVHLLLLQRRCVALSNLNTCTAIPSTCHLATRLTFSMFTVDIYVRRCHSMCFAEDL